MPDARALSDHHDGISARLVYTEPMLRRAVWTVMVRRVARGPIGLAVGVFVLATLVLYAEGVTGFILGAVIVGLILLAMSIVAIWRAHLATTIGKFRALAGDEALLIATTSDATFRSAEGSATLPWRLFTEVWGIGDCWMLFTAPGQFSTIPMSGLNEDARAFLASRLPPFAMRRPEPPSGRLTELEVLAIAKEAARTAHPGSAMAQSMGFVTLKTDDGRRTWSVASQTKGMQLVVDIDDTTGDVLAIRHAGIR